MGSMGPSEEAGGSLCTGLEYLDCRRLEMDALWTNLTESLDLRELLVGILVNRSDNCVGGRGKKDRVCRLRHANEWKKRKSRGVTVIIRFNFFR